MRDDASDNLPNPMLWRDTLKALRHRAIRLLARREHSRSELRQKLLTPPRRRPTKRQNTGGGSVEPKATALPPLDGTHDGNTGARTDPDALTPAQFAAAVDVVLDQMIELDLQSDERFAQALVRRRGPRESVARLAQTLRHHAIDSGLAERLLGTLADTEVERARAVWARRFDDPPQTWHEKARHGRFLAGRGFSHHTIRQVLK